MKTKRITMNYTCPMHPEVHSDKAGRCPKCGMKLVTEAQEDMKIETEMEGDNYNRLLIIIGLIALATIAVAANDFEHGTFDWRNVMINFMAGFFLVFSGFKLMDINGFAEGYYMYDLLAKRVFQYGYLYPLIELFFGLSFLTSFQLQYVTIAEVIVMVFSGIGVVLSMPNKQKIQCACLGTVIKVPLGTVTLVEDFGMAIMGIALIFASMALQTP